MRTVSLLGGVHVPCLGLGTWKMGESRAAHARDVDAVRHALEMGYRLIDTAEMYGDGGAERVVGEALRSAIQRGMVRREDVFIVTKVLPGNASRTGAVAACERSLQRLGTGYVDLYLLHWRGQHPLRDTVAAFESLVARGLIRAWGVSNFDVDDMDELLAAGGHACATNQVYYSLGERGIEFDLVPWQRHHRMPLMAYCPIGQGALARHAALRPMAERHRATPAQIALAWVLAQPGTIAIPKAVSPDHLRQNVAAANLKLTAADLAELDRLFPPPRSKRPLAIV